MTRLYTEHASLYERAFSWDIEDEVDWLLGKIGRECRSVLEPGCGTGRYLEAFGRRGLEAVGIDNAAEMVAAAGWRGTALLADMADFDLGLVFDGAFCPINTLALLSTDETRRHFDCMGRHLRADRRYLVQLAIHDPKEPESALRASQWETGGLRVTWTTEDVDLARGVEHQRSRLEILSGERTGDVIEEVHVVTAWTPLDWTETIAASPFDLTGVYDGEQPGRPRVDPATPGRLLWHELTRSGS